MGLLSRDRVGLEYDLFNSVLNMVKPRASSLNSLEERLPDDVVGL